MELATAGVEPEKTRHYPSQYMSVESHRLTGRSGSVGGFVATVEGRGTGLI